MTEKNRDKELHSDNAGFSLVELIIAILILAIITIPFLNLFVTSARVNNKSRRELRATTVAQDIMEGVKSFDIDGLVREFGVDESGHEIVSVDDFSVIAKSTVDTKYGGAVSTSTGKDKYEFFVTGVKYENSKFNAKITLDPNPYYSSEFKESGKEVVETLNNDNIATVSSISSGNYMPAGENIRKDGSFKIDTKVSQKMLQIIKNKYPDVKTFNDVDVLYREISLGFYELPETDKFQAAVEITLEYKYGDNIPEGVTVYNDDMDLMGGLTVSKDGNYYLFYYPFYISSGTAQDTFRVFTYDVPARLYIVKQKYTDFSYLEGTPGVSGPEYKGEVLERQFSPLELHTNEYNYEANFVFYYDINPIIRTNLNTCLANDAADISPLEQIKCMPGEESFFYDLSGNGIFDPTLHDGGDTKEFIYDVKIEVYEDKDGFSFGSVTDDDLLVELTGNMNN